MAENLDRGTFGEQGAGFFLGPQGYFFVEGPSGTQGHAANAAGFDGACYNIKADHLIIYDAKMFASDANVGKATAIDPAVNLAKNLDGLIDRVQAMQVLPARDRILDLLRQTRASMTSTGVTPPPNVQIAITNFGGNSRGITTGLAAKGITFIDMNGAPAVPKPQARTYVNSESLRSMAQSAYAGAGAYNARRDTVAAAAEATRASAQWLNDFSLTWATKREFERLTPSIAEAIAGGGGALVVLNIDSTSPPGNTSMVVARSINSAYVIGVPDGNRERAKMAWRNEPKITWARPPNVTGETRLLWIQVPKAP